MEYKDAAWHISEMLEPGKSAYLRMDPETPDFTDRSGFKAVVCNAKNKVEVDIDSSNVIQVASFFDWTIFNKEVVPHLYAWNFKAFASYFRAFCPIPKFVTPANAVIDLKPIEGFLGIQKKRPENFMEAVNRTKAATELEGWQAVYKKIHLPLSLRVLPAIETNSLLDTQVRKPVYPYYEIEGQVFGRMNCARQFRYCYLPHNMGGDVQAALRPTGYGWRFVVADFKYCEIAVLQWLSQDGKLKELLESGDDLYTQFCDVIDFKCENKREVSKQMLIAFIYGIGGKSLGEILNIPQNVAEELIRRIEIVLPEATRWLRDRQEEAKAGVVRDYFGRPRNLSSEPYKARNFNVQAVAATVCQERLIELWKVLDTESAKLAFSVHDGFGMLCRSESAKKTYDIVKQSLESESALCPGLKLKVQIKFGMQLDKMKVFWK